MKPIDPTLLIVTGAHLRAEVLDRPIAYRLRERVLEAMGEDADPASVLVCSDLWYLNQEELRDLPTISIGGPTVNALAAYWGDRLPSVFAVDGVMIVQADFDTVPVASCWGVNAQATAAAADRFLAEHLDAFLDAAGV